MIDFPNKSVIPDRGAHFAEDIFGSPEEVTAKDMSLAIIGQAVHDILIALGEDPTREGIEETPIRVARSLLEMTRGMRMEVKDVFKSFDIQTRDNLVMVTGIPFHSLCEHHMLTFTGTVDIGYIPNGRVLGLSKFARLVEIVSSRLQVQERMTQQICDAIMDNLCPKGVAVTVTATHLCMEARGVQSHGTHTITSSLAGVFFDNEPARNEFLQLRSAK